MVDQSLDADPAAYLRRIGIAPDTVDATDAETLTRLQGAHARSVPFETLSITGDPYGSRTGDGVSLALDALHEKLVGRHRGGFCYELNGLFGWLLSTLGFDVDRAAGMVLDDEGRARPPANHLVILVSLDEPLVVDVGMGGPRPRRPLPLSGAAVEMSSGATWRVRESDRPHVEYRVQVRSPGRDWTDRYVFETTPRALPYFRATCDYLQSAPESPFTGDPVAVLSTDRGYRKLIPDTFTAIRDGEAHEEPVDEDGWRRHLEESFGLSVP